MQLLVHATGHDHMLGLVPLLDVDKEGNLPSFFSSLLLLLAGVLMALTARQVLSSSTEDSRAWTGLALIALVMSVDEAASLHELLIDPIRRSLGGGGWLYFGWVIPGAVLLAAMAIAHRRFFLRQDAALRGRALLAAGLYFGGALGVELVSGYHAAAHGTGTLLYRALLVSIEEGMEMAGAIVLVRALLLHLEHMAAEFRITIRSRTAGEPRSVYLGLRLRF